MEGPVLYVIVNNCLGMQKGKISAQVGHVIEKITHFIHNTPYIGQHNQNLINTYNTYLKTGHKKIVLKATQAEVEKLCEEKDSFSIRDAGLTQIEANSLTVVGFPPSTKNKDRFNKFKLL